jgi:hypothetical protein
MGGPSGIKFGSLSLEVQRKTRGPARSETMFPVSESETEDVSTSEPTFTVSLKQREIK